MYFYFSVVLLFQEESLFNGHIIVEAGGEEAFVIHFMMNSPTLHGGFLTSGLLCVHGLWKLDKKFILP
jgi:hypothetical protein